MKDLLFYIVAMFLGAVVCSATIAYIDPIIHEFDVPKVRVSSVLDLDVKCKEMGGKLHSENKPDVEMYMRDGMLRIEDKVALVCVKKEQELFTY